MYVFSKSENGASVSPQEEEDWLKWLEEHRAFAFHGRNGQINLLKEKRSRGSEGYWYAYQRHEGQMVKRYVGRSVHVNMTRLEEIAADLPISNSAKKTTVAILAEANLASIWPIRCDKRRRLMDILSNGPVVPGSLSYPFRPVA